jgi:hypothetical protein
VSKDTILSIENGRLKMSSELALKVKFHTGCQIKTERGTDGHWKHSIAPISENTWAEYTEEDFKEHEQMRSHSTGASFAMSLRGAGRSIDLLLHAALRRDLATAQSIRIELEQFLIRIFADYGLEPELRGLLNEEWNKEENDLNITAAAKRFASIPLGLSVQFPSSLERKAHESARLTQLHDLLKGSPEKSAALCDLATRHSFPEDEVRRLTANFPDMLEIVKRAAGGKERRPSEWVQIPNRPLGIIDGPTGLPLIYPEDRKLEETSKSDAEVMPKQKFRSKPRRGHKS